MINPLLALADYLATLFNTLSGRNNAANRVFRNKATSRDTRQETYDTLALYYSNQIYNRELYGGALDAINETLGEAAQLRMKGVYNPVERIVEAYDNVFRGSFGKEILIAPTVNTEGEERPVNPDILDPIRKIWKWSNMNEAAKVYTRMGAMLGTVGIRVVAEVGPNYPNDDPLLDRRVYLQFEHPGQIEDVIVNRVGDVEEIITSQMITEGSLSLSGDTRSEHTYRQLLNDTQFSTERDGEPYSEFANDHVGAFANYANEVGLTPYVIAQHRKQQSEVWGAWPYLGSEPIIDEINALSAHLITQIYRHVNCTWVLSSNSAPPEEFNFSGTRVLYLQRKPGELDAGLTIQSMVANLSLQDSTEILNRMIEELRDRCPELKAYDGDFLAGQSGESVAQLRKPAEERILAARANYESSLIKAQQHALLWGALLGIFDISDINFTEDIEENRREAKRVLAEGVLDHQFNDRPALSITQQEQLNILQMETAIGRDRAEFGALNSPDADQDPDEDAGPAPVRSGRPAIPGAKITRPGIVPRQ